MTSFFEWVEYQIQGLKSFNLLIVSLLLLALAIISRVLLSSHHCTSPDSFYYLTSAQNIIEGRGFKIPIKGVLSYNTVWPILYPAVLIVVSFFGQINLLVASKILNVLLVIFLVYKFFPFFKNQAWLLVASFYPFVLILSYTWSETLFITILVMIGYYYSHGLNKNFLLILLLSIALFLTRYIGGFVLIWFGFEALKYLTKKQFRVFIQLVLLVLGVSIGIIAYFYLNYYASGNIWGGVRFVPTESLIHLSLMLIKALLNEFAMIRNSRFEYIDWLFLMGLGLQLFIFRLIFNKFRSIIFDKTFDNVSKTFFKIAGCYFIVIVGLRVFSPFDALDVRLLAPSSFLALLAIVFWLIDTKRQAFLIAIRAYLLILFLLALIGNWIPNSI